jgi:cytochrome c oxidase subunit 2
MNYISKVLWEFLSNWMRHSQLWPDEASTIAPQVDLLFLFLICLSLVGLVLVCLLVFGFSFRYRKSRNPVPTQIEGSVLLEATWTLIPLALFMICFVWGALLYFRIYSPPVNAMNIYVVGKQWMWKVEHPSGQHEINSLHVPTGRPVQLTIISQDVFHSFSIPAFRVKREAVPGRYNTVWFEATTPGTYHLFCTQYCGTLHSQMIGDVVVMTPADYDHWTGESTSGQSLAQNGERLFAKLGCITCHAGDASAHGPNLAGVYGTKQALQDGSFAQVDEEFLRNCILDPTTHVIAGFAPIMPTYRGQVSEDGIISLVEYIKQLQTPDRLQQIRVIGTTTGTTTNNLPEQAPPGASGGIVRPAPAAKQVKP